MHAGNKMCAGCHNLIDPIGFGFEKFDAIGMRREKHKLLFYPNLTGVAARRAKPKEIDLELIPAGAGSRRVRVQQPQNSLTSSQDAAVPKA